MAQFIKNYVQDLAQDIQIRHCGTLIFNTDSDSNVINVSLYNGQEEAPQSGSVACAVICSDGSTVPVTGGTISGNTVSVTLGADGLIPGQVGIGIQVISGNVKTTVFKAVYSVELFETDTVVDPSSRITISVGELVSDIETAVASIPADYSDLLAAIAPTFSTSTAYASGSYVWYSGHLYRFTAAHSAGAWVGTDAVQVALANDVSDLKSAIAQKADKTEIMVMPVTFDDWEQGNIATATGKDAASTTLLRTSGFHSINAQTIDVSVDTGYAVYIYKYSQANQDSFVSPRTQVTTDTTITLGNYYYRFLIAYDGSTASTAWASHITITSHPEKQLSQNDFTNAYKAQLDNLPTVLSQKADESEITLIESDLAQKAYKTEIMVMPVTFADWEQGDIAAGNGKNVASQTVLRTAGYHKINTKSVVITVDNGYAFYICKYLAADDNTYVTPRVTVTGETTITPGDYYYRFLISHDGTTASTAWADHVSIITKPDKQLSQNDFTDAYKTQLDDSSGYETIFPACELFYNASGRSANSWSDFFIIDGNIWFFKGSSDYTHTADDGKIWIYDVATFTLQKTIKHDWGHISNVNLRGDLIIIGSDALNPDVSCAVHVVSIDSLDAIPNNGIAYFNNVMQTIDVTGLATVYSVNIGTGCTACWGDSNCGANNIVYVNTNYGQRWFKILLGLGANDLGYGTYISGQPSDKFNGTWKALGHWEFVKTLPTKESPNNNYECLQGMEYYHGKFVCGIGHNGMMGGIYTLRSNGMVDRVLWDMPQYLPNGDKIGSWEDISSGTEGLCFVGDTVYQGSYSLTPSFTGIYKFELPV